MSRSGYTDDYDGDNWAMIRWRGWVTSATRGRRGQKLLTDMLAALDAMPEKAIRKTRNRWLRHSTLQSRWPARSST